MYFFFNRQGGEMHRKNMLMMVGITFSRTTIERDISAEILFTLHPIVETLLL